MTLHIVIDGVDSGGKTPLVEALVSKFKELGLKVATLNAYRVEETYHLWDKQPIKAATIITNIIRSFINENLEADVFVWDRGWPTTFVCTPNKTAHGLFDFLKPSLTIFVLNSIENTQNKRDKYQIKKAWYQDDKIKFYNKAYRELAERTPNSYSVIADGYYNLNYEVEKILHNKLGYSLRLKPEF